MSIIYFACDSVIPIGELIVIVSEKAVVYDSLVHSISNIIGVSYPKIDTNGRICANADGFVYNDADYFSYDETLKMTNTQNPNYNSGFTPVNDDHCLVCICGLASLIKTSTPLSSWNLVRSGSVYDLYLLK